MGTRRRSLTWFGRLAIAVTTKSVEYLKMIAWEMIVSDPKHRKELVAGNLQGHAVQGKSVTSVLIYNGIEPHGPVHRVQGGIRRCRRQ